MLNVYETIQSGLHFNKFELGELLFVEYNCPIEDVELDIWTPTDYLLHVLHGKKTWHSLNRSWTAEAGQTFFVKKGAYIIEQFFEEDFCMLLFFIPDDFIRDTVKQVSSKSKLSAETEGQHTSVIKVNNDITLSAYFQSMLTYFTNRNQPSDSLLILKLKELIYSIMQSPANNELVSYFRSLQHDPRPSLIQTMENNFKFNLSLKDFAQLCGRSVSSFKRDFNRQYHVSPGVWLRKRRMEYAIALLGNTDLNISQICLESGFKNPAHFSRIFKEELQTTPTIFRKSLLTS